MSAFQRRWFSRGTRDLPARKLKPLRLRKKSKLAVTAAIIIAGLVVGLLISLGLSKVSGPPSDEQLKRADNAGGDGKFPTYVTSSPNPNALKGYQAAVDYTDEMNQIPCFCGCGKNAGHKSVRYCFIEKRNGNDIMFDPHGSGCKICVDIALDVVKGIENGEQLKDIRDRITGQYREYLDSATPTPPIEN